MPNPDLYEVQTINNPNPIARFAHRTRYGISLDLVEKFAPVGGRVLDFGAGQGEFLHRLGQRRPDINMTAFEPIMELNYPEITRCRAVEDIEDRSVDVICAFETLEHLTNDFLEQFISTVHRVGAPGAKLIVSVPIMQGIALPLKELSRMILHRRRGAYSTLELIRGTLGAPVERPADPLLSHKGFDQRELYKRFSAEFRPIQKFWSPIKALPWWINSQAFFVMGVS